MEATDMIRSQRLQIFSHLRKWGTITAREARELYRCERCAARVCELRKLGVEITTTLIPTPNNRARFARYGLEIKQVR